jgi:hypothetical protein
MSMKIDNGSVWGGVSDDRIFTTADPESTPQEAQRENIQACGAPVISSRVCGGEQLLSSHFYLNRYLKLNPSLFHPFLIFQLTTNCL